MQCNHLFHNHLLFIKSSQWLFKRTEIHARIRILNLGVIRRLSPFVGTEIKAAYLTDPVVIEYMSADRDK